MTTAANWGIFYHFLGALAAASFYIPIKLIKNWEWEVSWFVNGIASWIVMPLLVVAILLPDVRGFYSQIPAQVLWKTYLLGALWGIGGLTFGMTIRYLGLSIGYGVAIGITLVVGTIMPPLVSGELLGLLSSAKGGIAILGIAVAILGIVVTSFAGFKKENERDNRAAEFNLKKGIVIAIVCGVLSAFMAFAIASGKPIEDLALSIGIDPLYKIMPSFVVIMLGGFTTNALYCFYKARQNGTWKKWRADRTDFWKNTALAALGGIIWYLQFFFYGWGHVQMENAKLGFISWTLHMSLLVLGGGMLGLALKEWEGCTPRPLRLQLYGMATIILSTLIIGLGANG